MPVPVAVAVSVPVLALAVLRLKSVFLPALKDVDEAVVTVGRDVTDATEDLESLVPRMG